MPGVDSVGICGSQKSRGLGLRTQAHSSLPAGLSLHFHTAPATFDQSWMGSWGRASVQQPFLELCRAKGLVRRLQGGRCRERGLRTEAGAENVAKMSLICCTTASCHRVYMWGGSISKCVCPSSFWLCVALCLCLCVSLSLSLCLSRLLRSAGISGSVRSCGGGLALTSPPPLFPGSAAPTHLWPPPRSHPTNHAPQVSQKPSQREHRKPGSQFLPKEEPPFQSLPPLLTHTV